jgi:hypothetical protein
MLGQFRGRASLARNREVGLTKKRLYGNIEPVRGAYVSNSAGGRAINMDGAEPCNIEEFACHHFRSS